MSRNKLFAGKLGKSAFTFILGAILMVSVSAAVAQTQNPPAGDINATFDSVTVTGELQARTITTDAGIETAWVTIGGAGIESNTTEDPFASPVRFRSPVEFYSPISGRQGVGSGTDQPLEIEGDVKLNGGTIRNGDSGGSDMVVFNDNVQINNSLMLEGTGSLYVNGGIVLADQIGTTYKVTDRNGQSTSWNRNASSYNINARVGVTASCREGTVLVGCSGYLWENPGQARFEYMGAEKVGESCQSYARRKSLSDTSFSHYTDAICFDPSLGGRNDVRLY